MNMSPFGTSNFMYGVKLWVSEIIENIHLQCLCLPIEYQYHTGHTDDPNFILRYVGSRWISHCDLYDTLRFFHADRLPSGSWVLRQRVDLN